MDIISFSPSVEDYAGEQVVRVLTFNNDCYALHRVDKSGASKLTLYDGQGNAIVENVRAESAYVFNNGNYVLMYEPVNVSRVPAKTPMYDALHIYYRLYKRNGRIVLDDIELFEPLAYDWFVITRRGVKELYNSECECIDKGANRFLKLVNGYVRVDMETTNKGCVQKLSFCDDTGHVVEVKTGNGEELFIARANRLFNRKSTHYGRLMFENGNSVEMKNGRMRFFKGQASSPMTVCPAKTKGNFLPDGSFYDEEKHIIFNPFGLPVDIVDEAIYLGHWFVLKRKGVNMLYDDEGNLLARSIRVVKRLNSLLIIQHLYTGVYEIRHKSGLIIPPIDYSVPEVKKVTF